MGKLSNLKPRLSPTAPRLSYLAGAADTSDHGGKGNSRAGHQWYNLAKWKRLRWSILVRDGFKCQMCGRLNGYTKFLVADHKVPHRGNSALFWDANNLWTLCKSPCHDKHKQAMEIAGRF